MAQNTCTTGTVIGNNTGVYIGGLPNDFVIQRNDSNSKAKVRSLCFIYLCTSLVTREAVDVIHTVCEKNLVQWWVAQWYRLAGLVHM